MTKSTNTEIKLNDAQPQVVPLHWRTLAENINDGLLVNLDGQHVFVNRHMADMLGYEQAELLGTGIKDVAHPDELKLVEERARKRFAGQDVPSCYQTAFITKTGEKIPVELSASLTEWEGKPGGMVLVRDIRERLRTDAELKRQQQSILRTEGLAQIGSWEWDLETNAVLWSPEMYRQYGLDAASHKPNFDHTMSAIHPDDLAQVRQNLEDGFKTGNPQTIEYRILRPDGELRWVYGGGNLLRNSEGKVKAMHGYLQDITGRKLAENALLEASELNDKIISESPVGIGICDSSGKCVAANSSLAQMVGATREQLLAQNYNSISSWRESGLLAAVRKAISTNSKQQKEIHITTSFGKNVCLDFHIVPFQMEEESRLLMMVDDVTERMATEKALRNSEAMLEKAQQLAHIGHWKLNPATSEVQASNELFRIFNLSREEASLESFVEVVHPDDREMDVAAIQRGAEFGEDWDIEHRLLSRTGIEKWVHAIGEAITDESGNVVELIGTIQDITERKKAESERAFVEVILRSLATSGSGLQIESFMHDALERLTELYQCDYAFIGKLQTEGQYIQTLAVRANGRSADNYQYSLQGTPCKDILDHKKQMIPRDAATIYADDQLLNDMEVESYFGAPLSASNGSSIGIIAVMDTNPMELDQWTEPVLGVFATRLSLELERDLAFQELQQHQEHLEEMVQDRTKELRDAQDELVRSERLATLGQLTATVSHELRNPLSTMRPSLYIIEKLSNKSEVHIQQALKRLDRSIKRCDSIIDELLDFTRLTEPDKISIRIDKWLESVIDEQVIPEGIIVEKELSLKDVKLSLDSNRLRRAVINVVENACHAMQNNEFQNETNGKPRLRFCTGGNEKRVEIVICDNGAGIAEDVLEKMFEPLYSTKPFGVGLGMPTVKQIMEQHNGGIEVQTDVGLGTTIVLWVPRHSSDAVIQQSTV